MAFRFPLASVLAFRESLERREELALTKIQLEMARVQHEIEQLTAELVAAQRARDESMRRPIPAAKLQEMLHASDAVAERKKKLQETLAGLEQQRSEQLRAYHAAHRARQVLTDLRIQHHDAWDQRQARAQQKMLDDVFASRSRRG